MKSLRIILNVYQSPNDILRGLIQDNQLHIPINGGSGLKHADEWCKKNLIFEADLPDNISKLNYKLNEMTSIYACWKNYDKLAGSDYIGFNHYRRFFDPKDFTDYEDFDIIVGKHYSFATTLLEQYRAVHKELDIYTMLGILHKEYKENIVYDFMNQYELFAPCNMFIMKKELFFKYCEFLFDKLFKLEQVVDLDKTDTYQKRALAFLSERLTSFWMLQQLRAQKKIKEIPIVFFEDWTR